MNCQTCRWSHTETKETPKGTITQLQCRQQPPKLVTVSTRMETTIANALTRKSIPFQRHNIVAMFPQVQADWWCGYYAMKEGS